MTSQNYATTFVVDQTPEEAFAAITNVRGWWSGEIDGSTDQLGEEFTYRYQDVHYSKQRITELVPGQKVVWHVLDAYLDFTDDPDEWVGTDITFEVARKGDQTEVQLHPPGSGPRVRMLRHVLERLGLLHQQQPAEPDHHRYRGAEPQRGSSCDVDRRGRLSAPIITGRRQDRPWPHPNPGDMGVSPLSGHGRTVGALDCRT